MDFFSYNKSFINGEWVEGESSVSKAVDNPYDRQVLMEVKLATLEQVRKAFSSAQLSQKEWGKTDAAERRMILEKAVSVFEKYQPQLVETLIKDSGSTRMKAEFEVYATLLVMKESIKMTDKVYTKTELKSVFEGRKSYYYRLPKGVISCISPFNFPMYLSARTLFPAIALGNTVVHKPDIKTAVSGGVIFAAILKEAGLPKGVYNLVLTNSREIGDEMLVNPAVARISFTGSTEAGRHIGEVAGRYLKDVSLELGGNNPFVVLGDADVDKAVACAIQGRFFHQGQICMSTNRIIVSAPLYEAFVEKFVEAARRVKCGDPSEKDTLVGPLIDERQIEKALKFVEDAKKAGNKLALEGKREGNVITPFVFVDVDNKDEIAQNEMFSPIVSIIKAASDEEAIELANDTPYGLSSAVHTGNLDKGFEAALKIESGMTHINDHTVQDEPAIPFGGVKASGIGRFGNPWIAEEFTELKWVTVD
ncbi:aldehyde dehydrogenase family protein [Heyndrickxia faecalis]|uniref:Putative benzaldehyde dehydrogenase AreC n=1 Tax=Heyndrickxia coagulans TaxID=1398 RepID=A0A133KN99_HEYCO|nr:aldehyde dehydrogenase family protein [Heyndrickxia coagulans]KWZ80996.1 putative benzaldehyde dehydrogenase AreC [Heyndrickxia coagulans]